MKPDQLMHLTVVNRAEPNDRHLMSYEASLVVASGICNLLVSRVVMQPRHQLYVAIEGAPLLKKGSR